jgi:hypothetical protein
MTRTNHKTTENISVTNELTISIGDAEHVTECDYVGIVSLNKEPKFRIKDSEGKSDDAINNKNIYFNKAGFNQTKQLEVNDVEDVIKVE